MKILLVDDDTFLLDMYSLKFSSEGHVVVTAPSVDAALSILRQTNDFDVILLDMILPGMSGVDFLKAIREENIVGKAKCIVLSNQSEKSDIDAAMEAGAVGYIVKAEHIPSEVIGEVTRILKK